jgi:acetyl-CoA acetyltransferase
VKDAAAVVGIGETVYVRRSERPAGDLIVEAVTNAIADAGLRPSDVDGIVSERYLAPRMMAHDELAATIGMGPYFSASGSVFGAGIAGAVLVAADAIAAGYANTVVCYFGLDWGSKGAYGATDRPMSPKANFELPYGFYGQPMYFAQVATHYRETYRVDLEFALGTIAVQQRQNALLNGNAQMRVPLTREAYLTSPFVAEPLRIADCCLLTDGAAALVLTAPERARDGRHVPVYVKGGCYEAAAIPVERFFTQGVPYGRFTSAASALDRGLRIAGLTRADIDFLELYDCFTIALLEQIEDLGFCGEGEGADFIGDGSRISLTGELPVNTHGGLLSHAYMLGSNHLIEGVRQLRRDAAAAQVPDAEVGMVGLLTAAEYCAVLLGRELG